MATRSLELRFWGGAAFVLAVLAGTSQLGAINYTVTKVADSGQSVVLAENPYGEIAFSTNGVMLYSDGEVHDVGPTPQYYAGPDINSSGMVVFWGWPGDTSRGGVWLYDPAAGTTNISDDPTARYPKINDSGTIVWQEQGGIWKYHNGQIGSVAPDGTDPEIGNGGHIAWVTAAHRLQITDGVSTETLPQTVVHHWKVSINSSGQAAYAAQEGGGYSTYLYDGTEAIRVGNGGQSCPQPKINDGGDVLYALEDGNDDVLVLRRESGEEVELHRSSWSGINGFDLNNLGNSVYYADYSNLTVVIGQERTYLPGSASYVNINDHNFAAWARDGVYLAVPEPATLSLLAIGGLALIRRRRRK